MRSEKKVLIAILVIIVVFYVVVVLPWIIGTPTTTGSEDGEEGLVHVGGGGRGAKPIAAKVHLVEPNDLLMHRHEVDSLQQQPDINTATPDDAITSQVPIGNEPIIKRRNVFTHDHITTTEESVHIHNHEKVTMKQQNSGVVTDNHNNKNNDAVVGETQYTSTICDETTGFHDDEEEIKTKAGDDFKVKAVPGGTEEEALSQRRQLLANNKPGTPAGKMRWRPATRQPLPTAVTNCMVPRKLSQSSKKMENNGDDDVLARAIYSCISSSEDGQEADLRRLWPRASVACLVRFYTSDQGRPGMPPLTSQCSNTYGEGLFKEFAKSKPWNRCESQDNNNFGGGGGSDVVCKSVITHFSHSDPTSVCSANNVVVDYTKMLDGDYPWLAFQRGALQAYSCHENGIPPSGRAADGMFMHCLADWMKLGYQSSTGAAPSNICSNPETTDDTPTLFLTRSGDFSPFAIVHDAINALVLYGVAEVNLEKVQVVVMDRMGMGFYSPLMQLLLSPAKPLKWLPDLRKKKKCYKQAYFSIPARLSPIYNQDDCKGGAPLYAVLSDLMQLSSGYQILQKTNNNRHDDDDGNGVLVGPVPDVITITIITRKNYATGHSIGRRIQNHKELVAALRQQITPDSIIGRGGGKKEVEKYPRAIVVRNIDYALWDFDQQIGVSASTDVLVAMHGAGLVQAIFLPRHSGCVFEIFCPEKPSSNYRYQQLSEKLGLRYDSMEITNGANIVDVGAAVRQIRALATASWRRKMGG